MDRWFVRPFMHGGYDFEGVHWGLPPPIPLAHVWGLGRDAEGK